MRGRRKQLMDGEGGEISQTRRYIFPLLFLSCHDNDGVKFPEGELQISHLILVMRESCI